MFSKDIKSLAKGMGRKKRLNELKEFVIEHDKYYISKISRAENIMHSSDLKDNFVLSLTLFDLMPSTGHLFFRFAAKRAPLKNKR
jgi:hypothetical protein